MCAAGAAVRSLRAFARALCLCWLAIPGQHAAAADAGASDPEAIGRRIYLEGVLPSGKPIEGLSEAGVTLTGQAAACTTCHRRSGYGSSEGPIEVRAITGPALFGERVAPLAPGSTTTREGTSAVHPTAPGTPEARAIAERLRVERATMFSGARPRPVYDDALLARAIREGIDVTGRRMNGAMPRYDFDAGTLAAIQAYLHTLSATSAPGVEAEAVHFATVIQPGTDPAQRQALVDVIGKFMHDRNLSQRVEARRELTGQVRMRRTFRPWELHVWELHGPADTWDSQLAAYYREQPVFALVSGMGKASWQPIHAFSERMQLPCILPQAPLPALGEPDIYTVYLSRGLSLDAQVLAKFLHDAGEHSPLLQVYSDDEPGRAAAAAFREAWRATGADAGNAASEEVAGEGEAWWRALAARAAGRTLVLWIGPAQWARAAPILQTNPSLRGIYLSASLSGLPAASPAGVDATPVRFVYPYELPAVREPRLAVVHRWMEEHGIAPADEVVQLNAYLAATATGMMVTHSQDTYSREYMLERMEHRLGTALELSMYPHLSLGPGQRFASKGAYVVTAGDAPGQLKALSEWIVP